MPSTAAQIMQNVVLPGDPIPSHTGDDTTIKLGPGLTQDQDVITSMKAGVLNHLEGSNRWWVESNQQRVSLQQPIHLQGNRLFPFEKWVEFAGGAELGDGFGQTIVFISHPHQYIPATGESVIGIVCGRLTEGFKVDIGAAQQALLPYLAFEGVTKKSRPNFLVGALVYARLSLANKDMEPELECVNPATGKADGFGELKGGFVFKCSLGLSRRLMDENTPILRFLAEQQIPFEITIGRNGRVWITSGSAKTTIMLANTLQNSEYLNERECREMVRKLMTMQ
ncbi:LOW QUALITY PROTEIN: hypothetical protein BC936DRAFT_149384 [Jimgerdemannia flammicorona]|uniref:Ribosomal RNA-processing protein 40 n=1 Tax=Jimgerdemannia flammicorona TaxID=994334 RepID=A0A433D0X5_9FUNG|nr:LOW QUALITY PROTEIN: hypothetical protein BC936DRAFT_149384 [Jimgerdemannia flammicorona]